jgi:uncharacterized membrane-anchored protein
MRIRISAVAVTLLVSTCQAVQTAEAQPRRHDEGIDWRVGPATGELGNVAQIRIPEGYRFSGIDGVRRFMELTENPVSGSELGVLLPPDQSGSEWFVVFDFNSVGYVKDDEKNKLDAGAILDSIKEGTKRSNEERRKRGWSEMDILGWHTPPRYNQATNNLTWAIRGSSEGSEVVNYSVRLLGRRGVMDVDLVLDPAHVITAVPQFEELLTGFTFTSGNRYAEFTKGDKVAAYGLTALVAGGAGAALAKSGLLGKIWKLLVVGAAAALAAIKRALASVFGKKETQDPASSPS